MSSAPQQTSSPSTTIAEYEAEQIARANASGRQPVVFVHGLWLLPSSWDRWAAVFEEHGYTALTPGWPDDPETVAEANAHPDVFADKTIGQVAAHYEAIVRGLSRTPALVGHSFGGLLVQILAGRALSAATVAIDPAPFRGVLPLPLSALEAGWPVLGNPANRHRAVPLTYEQFRYRFANAARGPLLLISGEKDHTIPWALANAACHQQRSNPGVTEIVEIPNRGHALTFAGSPDVRRHAARTTA